jgi:hypothetical protein
MERTHGSAGLNPIMPTNPINSIWTGRLSIPLSSSFLAFQIVRRRLFIPEMIDSAMFAG